MIHWILFLLPLALVASKLFWTPRTRTYRSAEKVRSLLNPPDGSLRSMLLARAAPNQRLVHAFGLTSTFVSGDTKVHKTFTTRAKALIASAGTKDRAWNALAVSAGEATRQFLPIERDMEYATFVQCVTFVVILTELFKVNPEALHHDDVVYVTTIINKRWNDSKMKDAAAMGQEDSLHRLVEHMDGWITDRDQYPNPLNFVLPAYETMWRVVAVTIAYVYGCRDNTLRDIVTAFARDPTEERFQAFGENGRQPSMQAIILEVLRLHPPTRHIARGSAESGPWWRGLVARGRGIEIADIEAVHQTEEYGENASEFEPMRFHPSRMGVRADLYSFGYGRLGCIAAGWAPLAAAVIAGKVVAEMEEGRCTVTVGRRIGGRSGWDGWAVGRL